MLTLGGFFSHGHDMFPHDNMFPDESMFSNDMFEGFAESSFHFEGHSSGEVNFYVHASLLL